MVNSEDDSDMSMSDDIKIYLLHSTLSVHAENVKRYHHSIRQLTDVTSMLLGDNKCTVEVHDEYVKIVFNDGVPEKALELLKSFSTSVSEEDVRIAIPIHVSTAEGLS